MKFKSESSNPRVTNSNPRVTSSNSRIIKSMKTQVNSLINSSFTKIISPTLFDNSWNNSASGNNFLFYVSATLWLRLQQEAEWVNIHFERRDLKKKSEKSPFPWWFWKNLLFLCFQFKKTICNRFFFHLFYTKRCAVRLNYYCQTL